MLQLVHHEFGIYAKSDLREVASTDFVFHKYVLGKYLRMALSRFSHTSLYVKYIQK